MLKYNRIEELLKLRKLSQGYLAEKVGMTREGFNRSLKARNIKVTTLEEIAKILGVSESYFFQSEYATNNQTNIVNEPNLKRIENMTNLIESQKEIITLLKEKIERLEERLSEYEETDKSKQAI